MYTSKHIYIYMLACVHMCIHCSFGYHHRDN